MSELNVPDDVQVLRDVEFGRGGGRPLRMDIYRPKAPPEEPMPAVIWIHGGAWRQGDKESGGPRLVPLVQHGYFGASIEYRLSPEAVFPAQIEDCKCAVRYLRAHAEEYHINPGRIGAWGSSAGGHLVAMLGTTAGIKELEGTGGWAEQSSSVQAVCDWFGPTDFTSIADQPSRIAHDAPDSPGGMLIGGSLRENREKAIRASPVTYAHKDAPPFLIMHGKADQTVPPQQSIILAEALRKAGVPVDLVLVDGMGHGAGGFTTPANLKQVIEFFDKHLKGPAARAAQP